jgi:electron transport complex protein RnfC
MLMRESADEIVDGAWLLRELVGATQCIIAIERDKPQAIDAITAAAERLGTEELRIAELPSIYPAGGERQLLEVLASVELPSSRFPGDVGFLCQNVGTAYAVHRYFRQGQPLTSRIVTVTGTAVAEPCNVEAMIGTPIADLIALCGGYRERPARLIQGGSMMGFALTSDALPVTKATNCVIAASENEVHRDTREWPCIRCGECAIVCPARLQPQDLVLAARSANAQALVDLSLSECIECGCCDFVCPSHIPLTRTFQEVKHLVRDFHDQQEMSEAAERRYRSREQRLHEADLASERQRGEIRQSLGFEDRRAEEIRAAVERARQRKIDADGS